MVISSFLLSGACRRGEFVCFGGELLWTSRGGTSRRAAHLLFCRCGDAFIRSQGLDGTKSGMLALLLMRERTYSTLRVGRHEGLHACFSTDAGTYSFNLKGWTARRAAGLLLHRCGDALIRSQGLDGTKKLWLFCQSFLCRGITSQCPGRSGIFSPSGPL